MKYIKKFEKSAPNTHKKFIIVTNNSYLNFLNDDCDYYILSNQSMDTLYDSNFGQRWIDVKVIFRYTDENNFSKIVKNNYQQLLIHKLNIIYEADTLRECKNMLKTIKYNI